MPGDLLDVILLVLIAAFAVAGYRQGFIIGVLSLAGFVVGVAAGAYIAPGISRLLAKSAPWQAFIAILVVFLAAVVGMLIASGIGVAVRSRVTGRPATVVDALGGAAVNVVAVLVVAWLIGTLVANAPFPVVARQVGNSAVLRTVDKLMPQGTLYLPVFPALHTLLSNGLYTPVFGSFYAENAQTLSPADTAVLGSAGIARDKQSIVKIKGIATSCSLQIEGSGFVISPGHVLTNAHVVAGVTHGPYVYATDGHAFNARVVLFDPERDIAVLDVPGLTARPLRFAGPAPDGANAIVVGYPLNQGFTARAARVGRAITASGPSIYATTEVNRQVYQIRAVVKPGNSGGPLLAPDGRVYGVVFAASTAYKQTGYALTAGEVASDAAAGSAATAPVSTQGCQG
ncbi:MAG TPA: MarP family serine protease [Streptosporangiaceae bacterium]